MLKVSNKRLAIDKANANVVIAVSIAVFVVIFSLVAGKALMDQRAYQAVVIDKKKTALKQTKKNLQEVEKLNKSYEAFAGQTTNVLGGNPKGTASKDGENPRIVLDALPSKYDFPALATSLQKTLKDNNFSINSISGTDEEVKQASQLASVTPKEIIIPFSVGVNTSSTSLKPLLQLFERSIRPVQIQKLTINAGSGDKLSVTVQAKTFYQPEKKFDAKTEVVKRSKDTKATTKKTGTTKK